MAIKLTNMQKVEQKFQTSFNHWLKAIYKNNGVFELKHTRGKSSLNFKEVKEHQVEALLQAKHRTFVYKISDIGMIQVPFDCFALSGVPAFIVIKYASGVVCMIDIDDFLNERERSIRKSLTEERAKEIATKVINK